MCGTAAGGFMCFIARLIARPFMSWSDTTPAPNVKAAAMLPLGDSSVYAEAAHPRWQRRTNVWHKATSPAREATKERIRPTNGLSDDKA